MKKIYLVLVMVLCAGVMFAQQRTTGEKIQMKEKAGIFNSVKTPTDTLVPSGIANASGFYNEKSGGWGYITGTNDYGDLSKAQQFQVTTPYAIEGLLIWFGAKGVKGSEGTLKIAVWNMDGTTGTTSAGANKACPSTELGSTTVGMNSVDTGSALTYHSATFTTPINVTSDYAAGINFAQIGDDTIGIVHCDDGDPVVSDLSWEQWSDMKWYTLYAGSSWGYDIDLAIFPVVDKSAGLVEGGNFINGIKMSQNYPNPSVNSTTITYEIEKTSNVEIQIVDLTGKIVQTINQGTQNAGVYDVIINTNDLRAGTYFYLLKAGSSKLAKRMIIE